MPRRQILSGVKTTSLPQEKIHPKMLYNAHMDCFFTSTLRGNGAKLWAMPSLSRQSGSLGFTIVRIEPSNSMVRGVGELTQASSGCWRILIGNRHTYPTVRPVNLRGILGQGFVPTMAHGWRRHAVVAIVERSSYLVTKSRHAERS